MKYDYNDLKMIADLRNSGMGAVKISHALGIPFPSVRDIIAGRRRGVTIDSAGVMQVADITSSKLVSCGFESLHPHQQRAYAYLLGLYTSVGCITSIKKTFRVRLYFSRGYEQHVNGCMAAITDIFPDVKPRTAKHGNYGTYVVCYSNQWPSILKCKYSCESADEELSDFQDCAIADNPEWFMRGLLHGSRYRGSQTIHGREFAFYNYFGDQQAVEKFSDLCDYMEIKHGEPFKCKSGRRFNARVARKVDVTRIDELLAVEYTSEMGA